MSLLQLLPVPGNIHLYSYLLKFYLSFQVKLRYDIPYQILLSLVSSSKSNFVFSITPWSHDTDWILIHFLIFICILLSCIGLWAHKRQGFTFCLIQVCATQWTFYCWIDGCLDGQSSCSYIPSWYKKPRSMEASTIEPSVKDKQYTLSFSWPWVFDNHSLLSHCLLSCDVWQLKKMLKKQEDWG